jgi:hypothetical protein
MQCIYGDEQFDHLLCKEKDLDRELQCMNEFERVFDVMQLINDLAIVMSTNENNTDDNISRLGNALFKSTISREHMESACGVYTRHGTRGLIKLFKGNCGVYNMFITRVLKRRIFDLL